MTRIPILGMLLAAPAIANAGDYDGYHPRPDYGRGSVSVLIGTSTPFDHGPWTTRLTLEGGVDVVRWKQAALSLALSPTWMISSDRFNVGLIDVIEVPGSIRLRTLTSEIARPYLDAGFGAVFVIDDDRFGANLFRTRTRDIGWMTRAALGVEVGPRRGPMLVLEPVQWYVYDLGPAYSLWGAQIGIGGRF